MSAGIALLSRGLLSFHFIDLVNIYQLLSEGGKCQVDTTHPRCVYKLALCCIISYECWHGVVIQSLILANRSPFFPFYRYEHILSSDSD